MRAASSCRPVIFNAAFALLGGLGILIALFGIGMDYLLGTYPGLNLPQLLLIVAGLLLSLIAFRLRRAEARRRVLANVRQHAAPGLLIAAIALMVLEFVLAAAGIPTYFPPAIPETPPEEAPWWICNEFGCRHAYAHTVAACESGELSGRHCIVNRQGFSDTQDFAVGDDFDERMRVLMLGDSFAYGMRAEIGKSYVETVESNLPRSIVWNTALPGVGTNHALASFQIYAPVLQPQITILNFSQNDFKDNMMPMDAWLWVKGMEYFVRRYQVDRLGNAIKTDDRALHYLAHDVEPPASEIERLIGITRLGSLAMKIVKPRIIRQRVYWQADVTGGYLRALRDAAAAQDTALLVLLVPGQEDVSQARGAADASMDPSPPRAGEGRYQIAAQFMESLGIPWINPLHLLDAELDYADDGHWNTAGHQKIGTLLSVCLAAFQISQDLSDCESVEMP